MYFLSAVAPRAGAWIETSGREKVLQNSDKSPLAQGRGLKPLFNGKAYLIIQVAPRAGAWIETHGICPLCKYLITSPLAQGRGLKLRISSTLGTRYMSPLAQGRGLKHRVFVHDPYLSSSPLAQGRGLKHGNWGLCQDVMTSRPSRRGVD